jgi:hypothetical protein
MGNRMTIHGQIPAAVGLQGTSEASFAPPHAPLVMPKQVLTAEVALLRRLSGALRARAGLLRLGHRRIG